MTILEKNKETISSLCLKHKVKELYAFGSVLDDKKFSDKSDIDLLVEFSEMSLEEYGENYFHFIEELENVFNRTIDLVTIRFMKNRFFIERVNRTKKLLFAA
ncbi:MAG: nucleotidyltransferase family protein [Flavobacteriales bacterium]